MTCLINGRHNERGRLCVHDDDLFEELRLYNNHDNGRSSELNSVQAQYSNVATGLQKLKSASDHHSDNAACKSFGRNTPSSQRSTAGSGWLNLNSLRELQVTSDPVGRLVNQSCNSLFETENTFVKHMSEFADYQKMLDQRKRELLHKKWTEDVYEPTAVRLGQQVEGSVYSERLKRRDELYQQFLDYVNRTGHSFLDTFDVAMYYPLALHYSRPFNILKAKAVSIDDPTLQQSRTRSSEHRLMLACATGSKVTDSEMNAILLPPLTLRPLGRQGTDSAAWNLMPLRQIDSRTRQTIRSKRSCTSSQLDFVEWSHSAPDRSVVEQELSTRASKCRSAPAGKRDNKDGKKENVHFLPPDALCM